MTDFPGHIDPSRIDPSRIDPSQIGPLMDRVEKLNRQMQKVLDAQAAYANRNPCFESVTAREFFANRKGSEGELVMARGGAIELEDGDEGGVAYFNDKRGRQTTHVGPYEGYTLAALGGEEAVPGRVLLRGGKYVTRVDVRAEKDGGVMFLNDEKGNQTTHVGPWDKRTVLALGGQNALPGRILLRSGNYTNRVDIQADPTLGGVLFLNDETGDRTTRLGPHAGTTLLELGGKNRLPGRIVLHSGQYEPSITLDAASGDITLENADCAEDFDVEDADVEPGTVMVLTDEGRVRASQEPYDARVVGVVSGAGPLKPGIVLDRRAADAPRRPIALVGKTYCLADARRMPIGVGTLLTTSSLTGHAMAAGDQKRSFGAVLGKAMAPLASGQGLIPVLVALQ